MPQLWQYVADEELPMHLEVPGSKIKYTKIVRGDFLLRYYLYIDSNIKYFINIF